MESCLHVKRSKGTTDNQLPHVRRVSEAQAKGTFRTRMLHPIFVRFFRVGNECYLCIESVKLKIFLGSLDWATDQRAFSCESENFLQRWRKKEPW